MPSTKAEGPFKGFMASKMTMPKYVPPDLTKPEKTDEMYPVNWPSYGNKDIQNRIEGVLGPLSLFAPFPHEDEPEYKEIELERPVTPINEEVKVQPASLDQLSALIRRRIAAKPDVPFLSSEDQLNLAGIIQAEVSNIWPEICRQIDDPFLTPAQNKELNRRIAVHIITVSEQLFHHYLDKAKVLNSRGIFSGPANMSRLKAQLALDSNKFFNILMIRRYIVSDIRGSKKSQENSSHIENKSFQSYNQPSEQLKRRDSNLTYQDIMQTSRPKSKLRKARTQSLEHQIKEMTSRMPSLDTRKLLDLVADLPERSLSTPSEDIDGNTPSRSSDHDSDTSRISLEEMKSRKRVLLKRSRSMAELKPGETLLEELGADVNEIRKDELMRNEMEILKRERQIILKEKSQKKNVDNVRPGTREYAANDLKQLMTYREKEEENVDEDLPPLLQAITRNSRHDDLKVRMERKMKELEEKEKARKHQESIVIREPTKPQPATISSKVSNKLTVRTSDIRVSERVCMSSITLNGYATVYNDLLDEIDPATIKSLDKNLFLSEEIREVYKEIMHTIPTQHRQLDDDAIFIQGPEKINFSGLTASASLQKKPHARVINQTLRKGEQAPWGKADQKEWANMPDGFSQLKNSFGESDLKSLKRTNMDTTGTLAGHSVTSSGEQQSAANQKISSWLTWWRNTVTCDDYMKYLSTQETDHLGTVFHFYDSDDEDDYVDGVSMARGGRSRASHYSKKNIVESEEMKEKRKELMKQKEEYTPGLWNVNTVLLGGLGKSPPVEDESDSKTDIKDKPRSAKTLAEKASIARQAKSSLGRSGDFSGLSKDIYTPLERLKSPEPPVVSPQDRLEKVWTDLHMPDNMKLDMAIKYSCNEFYNQLPEVIAHWERATILVLKREALLEKLEKFERKASDPNRFFEKGHRGSSINRLEEAKHRSSFYKRIDSLEEDLTKELEYIKQTFNDIISFRGRPYVDKMKWDRIEMLYWLQEERKEHGIRYEAAMKQLPLKPAMLEPLHHHL